MNFLKLTIVTLFLFFFSCQTFKTTTLPLSKDFINKKKIGVVIKVDSLTFLTAGSTIPFMPVLGNASRLIKTGKKYKIPLKTLESRIKFKEIIQNEIISILKSKNKEFIFIQETPKDSIKLDSLYFFKKPKSLIKDSKQYAERDFTSFKTKYDIDEIFIVNADCGLILNYFGPTESERFGYAHIDTEIIDLNDNSLLQKENSEAFISPVDFEWEETPDLKSLENPILEAIEKLKVYLKNTFIHE